MTIRLFSLFLLFLMGCQSQSTVPPGRTGFVPLQFGTHKYVEGAASGNWCSVDASQGVPINPDATDPIKRYFIMTEGVYRIYVTYGGTRISLMFRKQGDSMEIFNSDNFPNCLTGGAFCKMVEGNTRLDYANQRDDGFSIESQPMADGNLKTYILLTKNTAYGVEVRKLKV